MRLIDGSEVWRALPMRHAIDALEEAIRAAGFPAIPQRMHIQEGRQTLLVMPALVDGWAGTKLITIDPDNPAEGRPLINGLYTLFTPPGLEPGAVIDGRALTELRTAAVSGLATRHLARHDAATAVIFGAGAQGRSHLLAMDAVRALSEVRVVAPRQESVDAFLTFAAEEVDVPVVAGSPEDVADADIVCACTSSTTPVFDGTRLPPGVHVNAIGAYRPDMQEVDTVTVTTSRVIVETRESAMAEKGDLVAAAEEGTWAPDDIASDLTQLLQEARSGRTADADRTLFSSVGHAFEDLVVARAIHDAVTG